jgi:hypothetical protein
MAMAEACSYLNAGSQKELAGGRGRFGARLRNYFHNNFLLRTNQVPTRNALIHFVNMSPVDIRTSH